MASVFFAAFVLVGCSQDSDTDTTVGKHVYPPVGTAKDDSQLQETAVRDSSDFVDSEPASPSSAPAEESPQEVGDSLPGIDSYFEPAQVQKDDAQESAPVDVVETESAEKDKDVEACIDSGGVYNLEKGKCFKDGDENVDELVKKKAKANLEISDTDDAEEIARKNCVNENGAYNTIHKKCFSAAE